MIYKSIKFFLFLFILLWKRKDHQNYRLLNFLFILVHINNKHKKHYVTKTTKLSLSLVYLLDLGGLLKNKLA